MTLRYDLLDRRTSVAQCSPTFRLDNTFDAVGNLLAVQELDSSGANQLLQTCTYDGDRIRLTALDSLPLASTYTYLANDNILFNGEWGGMSYSHDPANRQLTAYNVSLGQLGTNTFDSNGNLTVSTAANVGSTMAYDKENRMVSQQVGATLASYAYDSFGKKRVENTSGGVTTLVWDGDDYLGTE